MWILTHPLTVPEVLKVLALHQLEFGSIKFEVTEPLLEAVETSIKKITPAIAQALATPNGELLVERFRLDLPNQAFINLFFDVFFKTGAIFVQFDVSTVNGKRVIDTTRNDRIYAAIANAKATPPLLFTKRNAPPLTIPRLTSESSSDTSDLASDSLELELSGIEYEPNNKPVEDGRLTSTSSVSTAGTPGLYDGEGEERRSSSPLKLKPFGTGG